MSAPAAAFAELGRVRTAHAELVDERVDRGVCGCGCGEQLPTSGGGNGRARFVNVRHRQRAHRALLRRLAEVRGVPASLSVRELVDGPDRGTSADERRDDAQAPPAAPPRRRSPRPGVTVYFKSPAIAERARRELERLGQRDLDRGPDLELDDAVEALAAGIARAAGRRRAR